MGSTRLLTDGTGQVTDRYVYDAFGRLIAHAGGSGNAYQFAGEQRDSTGLDYLRARYYNSDLGRFISKDAFAGHLASPISENAYVYANANPVNFTDPSGYESLGELSAAEAIIGILSSISQPVITGALFGAAFSVVHQDLEIIEGTRDELSFDEVLQSTYQGAVLGPLFAAFPAAAIPFAVMGFATGVSELLSDRPATGIFDIVTSVAPFLTKQGREPILKQIEGILNQNHVKVNINQESSQSITISFSDESNNIRPLGGRGGAFPLDSISIFGTHKGIASGRPFFPEEIGLSISSRQLSTDGVRITERGVQKVENHLARFGADPQNEAQLQRLKNIAAGKLEPTQSDLNNYTHELRESLRYKKLGYKLGEQPSDQNAAYKLWNDLHTATLEDYGLKEDFGVLYHSSTYINE